MERLGVDRAAELLEGNGSDFLAGGTDLDERGGSTPDARLEEAPGVVSGFATLLEVDGGSEGGTSCARFRPDSIRRRAIVLSRSDFEFSSLPGFIAAWIPWGSLLLLWERIGYFPMQWVSFQIGLLFQNPCCDNRSGCSVHNDCTDRTMAKSKPITDEDAPSFEHAMTDLEQIIKKLESGTQPLDKMLADYAKAVELVQVCQSRLDDARRQIAQLVSVGEDGKAVVQEWDDTAPIVSESKEPSTRRRNR